VARIRSRIDRELCSGPERLPSRSRRVVRASTARAHAVTDDPLEARNGAPPTFVGEQRPYPTTDVVANLPHALRGLALRVRKRPVVSACSRHDGTLVAATHSDEQIRTGSQLLGEELRPGAR